MRKPWHFELSQQLLYYIYIQPLININNVSAAKLASHHWKQFEQCCIWWCPCKEVTRLIIHTLGIYPHLNFHVRLTVFRKSLCLLEWKWVRFSQKSVCPGLGKVWGWRSSSWSLLLLLKWPSLGVPPLPTLHPRPREAVKIKSSHCSPRLPDSDMREVLAHSIGHGDRNNRQSNGLGPPGDPAPDTLCLRRVKIVGGDKSLSVVCTRPAWWQSSVCHASSSPPLSGVTVRV